MHHILSAAVLLVAGIFMVAKGGDRFVDSASWIARAAGIPAFIIGATIVSIATTLPEITVSVMAAMQGSTELAAGNAVGDLPVILMINEQKTVRINAVAAAACQAVEKADWESIKKVFIYTHGVFLPYIYLYLCF